MTRGMKLHLVDGTFELFRLGDLEQLVGRRMQHANSLLAVALVARAGGKGETVGRASPT